MNLHSMPRFVWLIPIVMSLVALAPLPYVYYTLLRIVIFTAAGLICSAHYQSAKYITKWVAVFGVMALVFNPIFPIHLTRPVWMFFNLSCAAIFVLNLFQVSKKTPSAEDTD